MTLTNNPVQQATRPNKKQTTVIVIAICIVAVISTMLPKRDRPERLIIFDARAPSNMKVYHGELIWADTHPDEALGAYGSGSPRGNDHIIYRSVSGGPQHIIATVEPELTIYPDKLLTVSSDGVDFGVKQRVRPGIGYGGGSGGAAPDTRKYLGIFAAPARRSLATVTSTNRRADRKEERYTTAVTVRRVSLQGGAARNVCRIHADDDIILTFGSHALWTESKPYVHSDVTRGNEYWMETSQHSNLVWTDLNTYRSRTIRLLLAPQVSPGESGVILDELRPFPDSNTDLLYARGSDGEVFHIGQAMQGDSAGGSVEANGVLYWIGMRAGEQRWLMAEKLGSQKPQLVHRLDPPDSYSVTGNSLFVWHGAVYCLYSTAPTQGSPGSTSLARVHYGLMNSLDTLVRLPANLKLVGSDVGFLYYVLTEQDRSLTARLTGGAPDGRIYDKLYRVRLPD